MHTEPAMSNVIAIEGVANPTTAPVFATKNFPHVLSVEDGPYLVKDTKLREIACLLGSATRDEGRLMVSQAHALDPHVMSYEHRLKQAGFRYSRVQASPKEIAAVYAGTTEAGDGRADDTTQQKALLSIIADAAKMDVSDVKFVINGDWCHIRYIVHGRGRNVHQITAREGVQLVRTIYNSMLDGQGTSLNMLAEQDGTLRTEFAKLVGLAGARVATRPAKNNGLKLTMRLLPQERDGALTLESAGYTSEQAEALYGCTEQQQGVVLLSGRTGSGKSTTLRICLEHLDRREAGEIDIITIEDPIEYNYRGYDADNRGGGIVQTPLVKNNDDPDDAKNAWPRGIANLMRHAPKIIMPGEIRDSASAIAAFDFAMSGHGVWTTFHAFSAEGILLRLDEWGVSRNLLLNPALVISLVNQSLVRRLCDTCKRPLAESLGEFTPAQRDRYTRFTPVIGVFVRGTDANCPDCRGTGTAGRIIAAEVVTPTESYMQRYKDGGALAARRHWVHDLHGLTKVAHVRMHIAKGWVDPLHAERDVELLDHDHRHLEVV
jgi:general secretion pathway protein E